ncbi:glycosyltransferase [Sphingomonas sp.]|uniref:glycosyltransferase n=1 Tax=Sphingomonas sp. TaxID=28214 RepID=UPI0025E72A29|nr:glycosyltransferase [Sphingomonas sp.]MBV9529056.1 glycosyltransferase [Sphingomonas sp.]
MMDDLSGMEGASARLTPTAQGTDMDAPPGAEPQPFDDEWRRIEAAIEQVELRRHAVAAEILTPIALPDTAPVDLHIGLAEALARANQPERSDDVYERLLARYPRARRMRFLYAKRLHVRGFAIRALEVLESATPFPDGTKQKDFVDQVRHLCELLEAREDRMIAPMEDCRELAMKHALAAYRDRRVADLPGDRIERLTLITGGLGAGGAERQLSRSAAALELQRRSEGQVGGIAIERPIEVLVRSHAGEGRQVYLADLQAAEVEITEIDQMDSHPTSIFGIDDPELVTLVDYLPIRVNFGVRRLVAHFLETRPSVVSLWQDGACLFASFAAIIAGVPRIQLMFRGLPPAIRKHMYHPEYEVLYRSLAEIPGIQLVTNSKCAASAYAEWLGIPVERFSILYNGVQQMGCDGTEALEAQWDEFVARTPDATHVIGGVFRFNTDKRPTTWIRFAARYAKSHPDVRFLVVGAGRLFDDAVQLANDLGIGDRILFVGHSTHVGYWMKKMDVLVLMSSFEGLPNVLIEAQYLGVPVVSTPAGGASECFIEGVTGHILGCADKTDLDEACEKVQALLGRAQDPAIFDPATRDFLDPNFSVSKMLEKFMRITCGAEQ